jgi:homoserine kinase
MTASPDTIVVRAPATSANLGSGFDCLGLALDLWNEVTARPGPTAEPDNLVMRAARAVFDEVGAAFPGFTLQSIDRVPYSRGLGSSASAIACGVLLANHCLGKPLDSDACLRLATSIEGHPDNVVPCLLGGVQVATVDAIGHVVHARVPMRVPLCAVLFVPEHRIVTNHARGLLPSSVPLSDALYNVARASLLVAALASGRLDALGEATRDRLHQPYRLPLFPAAATLLDAAMQAGALGAYVSGAGPSVLALCTEDRAAFVASAFEAAAGALNVAGSVLRLGISDRGAHVVN